MDHENPSSCLPIVVDILVALESIAKADLAKFVGGVRLARESLWTYNDSPGPAKSGDWKISSEIGI